VSQAGSRANILLALALLAFAPGRVLAELAPFDLAGPSLAVKVTRGTQTLPISEVPDLAPGDRVWIRDAVRALSADSRIPAGIDESAAVELVSAL
jgi:hypothetical protein